jgi:hypothetical protein
MTPKSKIQFYLISLVFAFFIVSCENNKNDVIPDTYTEFTIDIYGDIIFSDLNAIGNSVIVTSQTNNWGSRAGGYEGNGIIVYRANLDDFYAYDRTCPYDYEVNGLSIKVNVDFTQAICPECSTKYELSVGGISSSGPGKYPLKNYRTSFDGQYLRVWNY